MVLFNMLEMTFIMACSLILSPSSLQKESFTYLWIAAFRMACLTFRRIAFREWG
ncbi:hypothetical protein BC938DRAFT_480086, partial [Jimgerdemannia flammicorona]